MAAMRKPCMVEGCKYLKAPGRNKCGWHGLLSSPIEVQVRAAERRLEASRDLPRRERVASTEWPPGERYCAGCQSYVPLWYAQGSRCKACSSKAAHDSHVRRTFDLDPEEYARLLAWQDGRCFICRQVPRTRRLAVDHDHATGAVRGLLCANDEHGCNVNLARLLGDPEAGRRLYEYAVVSPLERMRRGDPPKRTPERGTMAALRNWRPN